MIFLRKLSSNVYPNTNPASNFWSGNVLSNRSNTMVVRSNGIRVGSGYSGTVAVGYLHAVLVYGVALSTGEMTKVHSHYTNLFSKFGATLYN